MIYFYIFQKKYLVFLTLFVCYIGYAETIVKTKKPGTLGSLLTQEQQDTCTTLVIEGKLNSADIRVLRRMAGYREDGFSTGHLKKLDMRKANFTTDKEPFLKLNADEERLIAIARPEYGGSYSPHGDENYYRVSNPGRGGEVKSYPLSRNIYYIPHFVLNAEEDAIRPSIESVYIGQNEQGAPAFVGAEKNPPNFIGADFTKQFSKKDRRKVRSSNLIKQAGHELEYIDNHYVWKISLKDDLFTQDMFYKCPLLEEVALPNGMTLSDLVEVRGDKIRYYTTNP